MMCSVNVCPGIKENSVRQTLMSVAHTRYLIVDTVGVPKSTLVSKWVGNGCENLLMFTSHHLVTIQL